MIGLTGNYTTLSIYLYIYKVAITNVLLWIGTWSPYAVVVMIGLTGNYTTLTPLVAGMPSLLSKYYI